MTEATLQHHVGSNPCSLAFTASERHTLGIGQYASTSLRKWCASGTNGLLVASKEKHTGPGNRRVETRHRRDCVGSVVSSVATAWCPSLRSAPAQQRRFQRNAPEDHRSHEVTLASSIGYAKESKANAERNSVPQNVETLAAFASGQSVACSRHLPP